MGSADVALGLERMPKHKRNNRACDQKQGEDAAVAQSAAGWGGEAARRDKGSRGAIGGTERGQCVLSCGLPVFSRQLGSGCGGACALRGLV